MLLWSGASALSSAVSVSVVLLSLAALVGNAIHLSDVTVHPIRAEIFQIQGVDVDEDDTERLRRGSSAVRRRRCSDCDNSLEAAADENLSRARRQAVDPSATSLQPVAYGAKSHRRQSGYELPAIPNSLDGSYSLGPGTRKHGGHRNGGGGGGAAPAPGRRPPTGYVGDVSADGGGVKYYYPERQALPLPKCFHNPTGYVCCNEKLNDLIVDTYTSLEQKPKFHQCNVQLIAVHLQNAAENGFGTPFETIVAYEDFAQKIHFRGDLVCKVELGGRYMLAYATAADGYTPNGSGHPRPRRNATVAGISEVGYMDSWTSIHTSFI